MTVLTEEQRTRRIASLLARGALRASYPRDSPGFRDDRRPRVGTPAGSVASLDSDSKGKVPVESSNSTSTEQIGG